MKTAGRWTQARLGPLWIDALQFEEALDAVTDLVEAGEGGYVVTPNVDHLVRARGDRAFRQAYRGASLALVDGMPLVWASHLLGTPLPERISGSDLVLPLCGRAASQGWPVYLCGATPEVAARAAARLESETGVRIAGVDSPRIASPGQGADESLAALERIRRAQPRLLFVALGSPKQELWLRQHARALAPAVGVAVGAALDFLGGKVRRAPRWVSRAGFEWAFRLGQEPRRLWRRYLADALGLVPAVWRTAQVPLSRRLRPRLAPLDDAGPAPGGDAHLRASRRG